jgi:hypothetical protein
MMGHRQVEQAALFYEFSFEKHVPADHLLRSIDRFVDLQQIRRDLACFHSCKTHGLSDHKGFTADGMNPSVGGGVLQMHCDAFHSWEHSVQISSGPIERCRASAPFGARPIRTARAFG